MGYSTLSLSDHFTASPVAPMPMLGVLANATSSLRVGTLVLGNDFRRPATLAKELATLDVITEGRLEIGIGAGWLPADYDVSGIALESGSTRIERLGETLDVLDGVLRGGPLTYEGRHLAVHDLTSVPACVQQPRPPLLVGGGGARVLRLAGQKADIVSINWRLTEGALNTAAVSSGLAHGTNEKLRWVREGAGDRFPEIELHVVAYLTAIVEDRLEGARQLVAARGVEVDPAAVLDSPHCLVGSVDEVVDRLEEMRARWGISYVTVYDRLIEEFAPVVARLAGR